MVNSADGSFELPSGKDDTTKATVPLAVMREEDGHLVHLMAMRGDVFGMLTDPRHEGLSPNCLKLQAVIDGAIDKWPYSGTLESAVDRSFRWLCSQPVIGSTFRFLTIRMIFFFLKN